MKAQFDMKGETVNGIKLHLNPAEALVFLCALYNFSNSPENPEIDRMTARKMVNTYIDTTMDASMPYKKGGQENV